MGVIDRPVPGRARRERFENKKVMKSMELMEKYGSAVRRATPKVAA
jgi:hypothetical protein